jgi:hypothetical protein
MKRHYPILAAGAGLVLATVVGVLATSWSAEAAGGKPRFARPDYELARAGGLIDLTKYGALADARRLARLSSDNQACHDALAAAGVEVVDLPPVHTAQGCGYTEAVLVKSSLTNWTAPDAMPMACALAARLHLWERHVVMPAAEKYFGSPVVDIQAFGTFECRNVSGHDHLSEHAYGKAADISGFKLADGRVITVLQDYYSKGPKGDFLREIHDRACDLFDVTLGPNYNADHANHFHVDVGGEHACH